MKGGKNVYINVFVINVLFCYLDKCNLKDF